MKVDWRTGLICFDSVEPWYTKEAQGFKCNTIRELRTEEEADIILSSLYHLSSIEIRNPATNQRFRRLLTDVTVFHGRVVFSWDHPTELGSKEDGYSHEEEYS